MIIGPERMLRWPNKFVIITASKTYSTLVGGQITLTWRTSIGTIKCGTIRIGIIGGDRLPGQSRAGWFPWGWSSPVSYDFGDNVLYDNDIVYMNGEQVATADEYYQQATQLASTAKDDTCG